MQNAMKYNIPEYIFIKHSFIEEIQRKYIFI